MTRLLHHSAKPVTGVTSVEQDPKDQPGWKPSGFWISVEGEDDWANWCRSEGFRLENLRFTTEVILKPDARILRLSSAKDIDEFTEKYGRRTVYGEIHWDRVAETYQGIIIAPYIWERRHWKDTMWYYTWDCASGCIWDASAIDRLVPDDDTAVRFAMMEL